MKLYSIIRLAFCMATMAGCDRKNLPGQISLKPDVTTGGYSIPKKGPIIIVQWGQSNMIGTGQVMDFIPHPRVSTNMPRTIGPGYAMAMLLADAYPGLIVHIAQCAAKENAIENWMPGTPQYAMCIGLVQDVERRTGGQIIGLLAYQGESDTRDRLNLNWVSQFETLMASFRNDLGISNLPIVWARLGEYVTLDKQFQNYWSTFKDNQLTVRLPPHSAMIETEDQPVIDDVHHDGPANEVIGDRFYRAYMNLIN